MKLQQEARHRLSEDGSDRLGANVGRAATGAAKGAARFVSTPLRVAQRNYAVVGRQAFLTSAGVLQADGGRSR